MPNEFTLLIPAFQGGASEPLKARLRFRVNEGALSLWYELLKVPQALESFTDAVVQDVFEETDIEPFYGTPLTV